MNVTAFKEAQEAYAKGDYARALEGFLECAEQMDDLSVSDKSKFYHLIGNCYVKDGEPARAVSFYQRALETSSRARRPALLVNVGTALLNSQEYDKALEAFQAALKYEAYTTPYRAYSGIGAAQLKLGNLTEAGAAYREAALDPSNPMPAKALVNLGVCFMELGRASDAVVSYETALDFDLDASAAAKAKSNLGQAYMAEGRVQKAINAFESATADGSYELAPMARHDYELACTLKERLDSRVPGILNTGFIPPLTFGEDAGEPAGAGPAADDETPDPFEPKTYDEEPQPQPELPDAGSGQVPGQPVAADVEIAAGAASAAAAGALAAGAAAAAVAAGPAEAAPAVPAAADAGQLPGDAPADADAPLQADLQPDAAPGADPDAPTAAFGAVAPAFDPQPDPAAQFSPEAAFADLDKEEDALPSPDNTEFFDRTETDIDSSAKSEQRKARKRRGVGLKVAIVAVVACILVAAAGCAAYALGYGLPTQETVTEEFFATVKAGEDTDRFWAPSVGEDTRSSEIETLRNLDSYEIDAVQRSMSQSVVFVKATIVEGGEVYYKTVLGRSGISWNIQYVELYFPSENA